MKKTAAFNELIRKVRKDLFSKGPERIHTTFVDNMAVTMLHGNMTPTEKFIASDPDGKDMVHAARTKMIQKAYTTDFTERLEQLMGTKLVHLFSDMKVEEDIAISVFVFEDNIQEP
ncbi:hypothetical protein SK3146_02966 [Paenibacillus konkukensis]|uniref:Na+-translocating membrane potential-generating system MpsC domain-containing protein n=1 Tax=Paenibacillus konkukensis TaxID=2020716 RepID=A0ABY4RQT9_9BACL|nr:DUF2294 domain-containing protein [Paenibacillus konkukensis]UQZ83759.1 hypothetical protein SK3146_02966 [Paenibacillus konkukensis]